MRLVATGRGVSRQVGACRCLSHLLDIGDVLVHRRWRYEVLFAELGLDEAALQMAFGTVALDAAGRAGEPGTGVPLQGLVNRQGEIAVVGCRDRSRQVVGHRGMITGLVPRLGGYPHTSRAEICGNSAFIEGASEALPVADLGTDSLGTGSMAENVPKPVKKKRALQSPGNLSTVYVPIIAKIFKERYRKGASSVIFSLDDVRNAAQALGVEARNAADVIYRMRSRTVLPANILDMGFHVLRPIGRGRYAFEKASSTIFEPEVTEAVTVIDITPLPVRRLLPETLAEMDEQAILTVASYCCVLDHLTGMKIYRLRSHVRKSVPGIGQAELDAIDVGIAKSEDDMPVVFPIEAKALADALNRVQIFNMVEYARHYFPGLIVRPLAIKVDEASVLHVMEFNTPTKASDLKILKSASYLVEPSDAQLAAIRATKVPRQ